uniref:Uncharacterized protein LOC100372408 n=1 Tax=Saccoglossus kowalevskii TaxID=10224 RepID=A0ABM0GIY1_SACKO|nr:PREDICTED: uncharacterized protein LOC100372408 [Saccoglossus kowalevskii]
MPEDRSGKVTRQQPTSTNKINAAVLTLATSSTIQLLYDKLIESRIVKKVKVFKMTGGVVVTSQDLELFDVVILCHSRRWNSSGGYRQRFNELTELPYQSYQHILRDAERVKGKECVIMVLHDMDMTMTMAEKEDRRQDFLDNYHQTMTRYVTDVIICGDISSVSSYCFDAVTEFDDENIRQLHRFLRRAMRAISDKQRDKELKSEELTPNDGCCVCSNWIQSLPKYELSVANRMTPNKGHVHCDCLQLLDKLSTLEMEEMENGLGNGLDFTGSKVVDRRVL